MKDGSIVRLADLSEIEQQDLSVISEIRTHFIDRVKVEVHTATNSLIRSDDFRGEGHDPGGHPFQIRRVILN